MGYGYFSNSRRNFSLCWLGLQNNHRSGEIGGSFEEDRKRTEGTPMKTTAKLFLGVFMGAVVVSAVVSAFSPESENQNAASSAEKLRPVDQAADTDKAPDDTAEHERSADASSPHKTHWVSHYGDYYVTCMVTGGIRWYTAINQSNLNDALVNQTPSDEAWVTMCGGAH